MKASGGTLSERELVDEMDHWMPGNRPVYVSTGDADGRYPVQRVEVSGTQVVLTADGLPCVDDEADVDHGGDRAIELLSQWLDKNITAAELRKQARVLLG